MSVTPLLRLVPANPDAGTTPEPPDDVAMIEALRRGDASRARDLYRRIRPAVEGTVRRLLGAGDHEFEDMVQMAMVEIIDSLDSYRGQSSLNAWAAGVTAHLVFRQIRRRGIERRFFSRESPNADVSNEDHKAPVLRGLVARVLSHLEGMNRDRAWAFMLHDAFGYGLGEMAKITGSSAAAMQSRLVRGRKELHERIAKDPELALELASWEDAT